MAPGKARNNKRSSGSSSYASTVTTAVFIALGVLGVWVLTSNSVTPPQTTTRTTTSTADYSSTAKNSVFEDNPGQLPDEAIQSDDSAQSKKINAQERSQAENSNDSMKIQILTENADEAAESNIYKENLQSLQGKESVEEQEKQKLPETRVSEESSMTEGQQVEERTMEQERKAEETNQNNFEGEDRQKTRDEQERDGKEDVQESTVLEETQMNAEADRHHGSLQDPITDNYQQQTAQDELQKEEEEQKRGEDSQQREDEQESNGKEVRESKVIEEAQRNAEADHHGNLQDQISYKDQQQRTAAADHHGNRQDQISYKDQQQRNEEADHHGNLQDQMSYKDQQQTGQNEQKKEEEEEEQKQQQTGQDEQHRVEVEGQKQQQTGQDEQQKEEEEEEQKQQQTGQEEQQREEEQKQQQNEQLEQEIQEGTSHDQIEHDEMAPLEHDDTAPQQLSSKIEDQKTQQATTTAHSHVNDSETQNNNSQHENNSNNKSQHENNSKIDTKRKEEKATQSNSDNSVLRGENSEIPEESKESKKSWSTQADQSENEKERHKRGTEDQDGSIHRYEWQLCNATAGTDYIPCLDNEKAISKLRSRRHFEHRERHCPEEAPACLVPLPEGYKRPVEWPKSRQKIWYHNVPHKKLAEVKGHQNWVKVTGEFLTFPGGGTQFIHGALHYIDFVQQAVPNIAWGKHTRVILDVGCGVASFGGYLFDRDVLAMSFAPKDEHEAQVQFALERGIPAISAVMGSQRLPFPSMVFDLVHCARCRVPWHAEGGAHLLELNRVLRPGGYFVWSATPVYQKLKEDAEIWKEMSALTESMCWELVTIKKDKLNSVGVAIYHKPVSNVCYDQRKQSHPLMCDSDDDPNAAWYVALQSCMHRLPVDKAERGSQWPEKWPNRIHTPPYWLNKSQMGIYGKPAPDDFVADYEHWKSVVRKMYLSGLGISWNNVRNIMDMRAVYGGFAAAIKDLKVWVLNVVNVDSPDTLPIIYERGLFGIYHDWCESFSTYPRTFDLLHADRLFSRLKKRCKLVPVMAEIDRLARPGGKLIVHDESSTIEEVENLLKSMHWEVHLTFSKNQEGILSAQKSDWRPDTYAASF